MPGYKVHLMTAVLLYGVIVVVSSAYYQDWYVRMVGFLAICAGALFPDIDIKSKGQHYLYRFYAVVLVCALGMYISCSYRSRFWSDIIICLAIMSIAPMLVRHRGVTHDPRFIILLGSAMWVIGTGLCPHMANTLFFYSICFVFGALSHVWLDRRGIFFIK